MAFFPRAYRSLDRFKNEKGSPCERWLSSLPGPGWQVTRLVVLQTAATLIGTLARLASLLKEVGCYKGIPR
jgi:hypothetical protein